MSIKNSHVTSDYIEWDSMLSLVRKLYRDGEYRLSLLIGCGCFFGLRISDLLSLDWTMILDDTKFTLIEKRLENAGNKDKRGFPEAYLRLLYGIKDYR